MTSFFAPICCVKLLERFSPLGLRFLDCMNDPPDWLPSGELVRSITPLANGLEDLNVYMFAGSIGFAEEFESELAFDLRRLLGGKSMVRVSALCLELAKSSEMVFCGASSSDDRCAWAVFFPFC